MIEDGVSFLYIPDNARGVLTITDMRLVVQIIENAGLRSLTIRNMYITDEHVQVLVDNWPSTLARLALPENEITNIGASAIFRVAAENPQLVYVNLSSCFIEQGSDEESLMLPDPQRVSVNLSGNYIDGALQSLHLTSSDAEPTESINSHSEHSTDVDLHC